MQIKKAEETASLAALSADQQAAVIQAAQTISSQLGGVPSADIQALASASVVTPPAETTEAEGEGETEAEEATTDRPVPVSDAADLLKGIASASATKVYKLDVENAILLDLGPNDLIFSDTSIKITNTAEKFKTPVEKLMVEDIDFSKMEVTCQMNGAPTLCKGDDYMAFNNDFKTHFEPIKDSVSAFNFVLESEFGSTPYLIVFADAKSSMDFKLYTL